MKAVVIGLSPEYIYPGKLSEWDKNNTYYAANLGACLISNSILRQFDADYLADLSDPRSLREKYDVCILALATHLHPSRDIWQITRFVEELGIKTIMLSAGISDYFNETKPDYGLHPSVRRLLEVVSSGSRWIGVRGPYSAAVLHRHGFNNVIPIGCPTMYWGLSNSLSIAKKTTFERLVVPYHLTLALDVPAFLSGKQLLGQDFQDQLFFTDSLDDDIELKEWMQDFLGTRERFERASKLVLENGKFFDRFQAWFEHLGTHDFLLGPRLHGCIAGLIQGIPAVMVPRDLRVREIAEFYRLPSVTYDELKKLTAEEIYAQADFDEFNSLFPKRYETYVRFLNENGLEHRHEQVAHFGNGLEFEDYVTTAAILSNWSKDESIDYGMKPSLVRRIRQAFER